MNKTPLDLPPQDKPTVSNNAAIDKQLRPLLEDYKLSNSEGYPVLSVVFADGSAWSKLIWPRTSLPSVLHRWNTPEEILSFLISFDRHETWVTSEISTRPPSGTIRLYNKSKTKNFRDDGYDWKTRASKKTVREDRMKLKVLGQQLISATYSHSESNSLLHRRCYWFNQNPDFVLVHYLETDSNSHKKTVLKKSQENGFEVTMEGTVPLDTALIAISDDNICRYLAKGHDGDNPQLLLSTLSNYVWFVESQNSDVCPRTLIGKINEKLHSNITSSAPQPETVPVMAASQCDNVPLLLVSQALELLKLKAYSSQYGSTCLLPKGMGCLPPSVLLKAASLITTPNIAPPISGIATPLPVIYAPPQHQQRQQQTQLPVVSQQPPPVDSQSEMESDVLQPIRPPSLDCIRSFLPQPCEPSDNHVSSLPQPSRPISVVSPSGSTPPRTDFNMEAFSQFAQNLRNMNPLKDLQNLKSSEVMDNSSLTATKSQEQEKADTNTLPHPPSLNILHSQHNPPSQHEPHSHHDPTPQQIPPPMNASNSIVELSALEKEAISLLSPNQISDLMCIDFESTVPSQSLTTIPSQLDTSTAAETFLDQFFNDISSDSPQSAPFDPDSLLQTPSMFTSTTPDNVPMNNQSEYSMPIDSQQLDIDSETLAQLLANSSDHVESPPPYSPTSQYIESLVPCYSDQSMDQIQEEPADRTVTTTSNPLSDDDGDTLVGSGCGPLDTVLESTAASYMKPTTEVYSQQECQPHTASLIPSEPDLDLTDLLLQQQQQSPCPPSNNVYPPAPQSSVPNDIVSVSYRISSPLPSPSSASVSSLSTTGAGEGYFDQTDPPSVVELCEMLGESGVIQTSDFSHLSLSDSEQHRLMEASRVIQDTMRKCKDQQNPSGGGREKDAVLCIERNYKRYRELKRMKEAAARRIQIQYRLYKRRTEELNRATLFIQQMYRYQKRRQYVRSKHHDV